MDGLALKQICGRLQRSDETLTLLNLSCRNVCSEGLIKMADAAAAAAEGPVAPLPSSSTSQSKTPETHLIALWLEGNDNYSSGARALKRLVGCSPHLKYLYLSNNHIGNGGINALTAASQPSSSSSSSEKSTSLFSQLDVLNVGDNDITATGAHGIAEALSGGKVTARDTADDTNLLPVLAETTNISTLILDNNKIGDEGIKRIAQALKYNTSLKKLDVRYNNISIVGLRAIRDVLKNKQNTTLQTLCFEEHHDDVKKQTVVTATITSGSSCCCCCCTRSPPSSPRLRQRNCKSPRVIMESRSACNCEECQIRYEIDYYLAMNRAGLRTQNHLGDVSVPTGCWSKVIERVTYDEPSILYTILKDRPDIPAVSNLSQ
mmetsp:Transcript_17397/g.42260  ORF Transcript_17397/g.42260 Transcript_17397/m.42260 type:complete len:376 (-) Transcript_17397:1658-2785(-)